MSDALPAVARNSSRRSPLAAFVALVAPACATDGAGGSCARITETARQAILAGEPEPAPLAVAVFTRPVPSLTVCSGALVAANLVLTARHRGRFTGPTGPSSAGRRRAWRRRARRRAGRHDRRRGDRVGAVRGEAGAPATAADPVGDVPLCGADLALLELRAPRRAPARAAPRRPTRASRSGCSVTDATAATLPARHADVDAHAVLGLEAHRGRRHRASTHAGPARTGRVRHDSGGRSSTTRTAWWPS